MRACSCAASRCHPGYACVTPNADVSATGVEACRWGREGASVARLRTTTLGARLWPWWRRPGDVVDGVSIQGEEGERHACRAGASARSTRRRKRGTTARHHRTAQTVTGPRFGHRARQTGRQPWSRPGWAPGTPAPCTAADRRIAREHSPCMARSRATRRWPCRRASSRAYRALPPTRGLSSHTIPSGYPSRFIRWHVCTMIVGGQRPAPRSTRCSLRCTPSQPHREAWRSWCAPMRS